MTLKNKTKGIVARIFVSAIVVSSTIILAGCTTSQQGTTGGLLPSFLQEPIYESCDGYTTSTSSAGKVTEIDGVELKMPVDWNLAFKEQGRSYKGSNYEGDDANRGIGIFNVSEGAGDDPTYTDVPTWKDTYAVNMRWEYIEYGYAPGVYPSHANYKGTDSSGKIEVGGTDASCVQGSGIIDQKAKPNINEYINALSKARIVVYNPETDKACVCGVGLTTVGKDNMNWGGAPLSLLGGITPAVTDVIGAVQNKSVLECYFVDPSTELGECEFDGLNISKSSASRKGNNCDIDNVATSIEEMAVSVAFDEENPDYQGHEMVMRKSGGGRSGDKDESPTTDAAVRLREITVGDSVTDDCGKFVASVVRATVDVNYPQAATQTLYGYMMDNPDYKKVAEGKDIPAMEDQLRPGDILVTPDHSWHAQNNMGHIFIYVGHEAIEDEFEYRTEEAYSVVGASWGDFGPKIQRIRDDGRIYTAFRFVGTPNPHPAFKNIDDGTLDSTQKAIIDATYNIGWPGANLCATWTTRVYQSVGLNAGGNGNSSLGNFGYGANYNPRWATTDLSKIKPGMIISSEKGSNTSAGNEYGHVGIYIGQGMVRDSVSSGIRTIALDQWVAQNNRGWIVCGYTWDWM